VVLKHYTFKGIFADAWSIEAMVLPKFPDLFVGNLVLATRTERVSGSSSGRSALGTGNSRTSRVFCSRRQRRSDTYYLHD
jgi:hypothetical protein